MGSWECGARPSWECHTRPSSPTHDPPAALPPPSLKPQQNQTKLVSGQNRCAENENTTAWRKRSEGTRARTRGSDGGGDRGRGSGGGGDRETS